MKKNDMNKKLMIYSLLFIAVSCSTNIAGTNEKEIFVDFENDSLFVIKSMEDLFNYSDYLDSAVYVPLETSDNCLIGDVEDIHFVNNKIFLSDKKNIYVFDLDGKIISKWSRFGRGHGEYVALTAFDVNPSNEEISIYDNGYEVVHVYSINGDFIRNVKVEGLPRDFCVLSNGNYLFYTPDVMKDQFRGVWQTDSDGKFINHLIDLKGPAQKNVLSGKYLVHINYEEVGLIGPMGFDNVYHITTNSSQIAYLIKTDAKIRKSTLKDNTAGKISEQQIYLLLNYYETKELVCFCMTNLKGKEKKIMYVKDKDRAYIEINSGMKGYPFISGDKVPYRIFERRCDYGVALGIINASNVMMCPADIRDKIAPGCTMDSNPIVCLYYYRK